MRSPEGAQKQQATPAPGANGRSGGYEADSSGANRARRSRSLSAAVVAKDRWERGAASGPAATSARGVASPTTRMLLTSGSGGGSGSAAIGKRAGVRKRISAELRGGEILFRSLFSFFLMRKPKTCAGNRIRVAMDHHLTTQAAFGSPLHSVLFQPSRARPQQHAVCEIQQRPDRPVESAADAPMQLDAGLN